MTSHSKSHRASGIFLLMISRALLAPDIHLWLKDKIAKYLFLLEECLAEQDSLISKLFCLGAPNHTFKNHSTLHLMYKAALSVNCFSVQLPLSLFKFSGARSAASSNFHLILIELQPMYDRSTISLRSPRSTSSKSHFREVPSFTFLGIGTQSQSIPDPPQY